jgi:hypothetical protein
MQLNRLAQILSWFDDSQNETEKLLTSNMVEPGSSWHNVRRVRTPGVLDQAVKHATHFCSTLILVTNRRSSKGRTLGV